MLIQPHQLGIKFAKEYEIEIIGEMGNILLVTIWSKFN